jgi:hypothetical protein
VRSDRDRAEREELWRDVQQHTTAPRGAACPGRQRPLHPDQLPRGCGRRAFGCSPQPPRFRPGNSGTKHVKTGRRRQKRLVDAGYTAHYDYALQTFKEIPYAKWREYDVEDTVRFYSLRLREAGMIKSAPNKIIAQDTDWRFFNELNHELKG